MATAEAVISLKLIHAFRISERMGTVMSRMAVIFMTGLKIKNHRFAIINSACRSFKQSIRAPLIIVPGGRVVSQRHHLDGMGQTGQIGIPINFNVAGMAIHEADGVPCVIEKHILGIGNRLFRLMPRVRKIGWIFRNQDRSDRMLD
jgi:hypothetical protein